MQTTAKLTNPTPPRSHVRACFKQADLHGLRPDQSPLRVASKCGFARPDPAVDAHGKAITAQATITTSESPKLYSERPATRKPVTAAMLPATSARSPARFGSRARSALMARR